MSEEIWKSVVGFPDYEVSSLGRVRSLPRIRCDGYRLSGRMQKPYPDRQGYLRVYIVAPHWKGTRKVHQLVLEAFVGPRPDSMVACHNNGNNQDNRPENLRWDTSKANKRDSVKHGTCIGEMNPYAKLNAVDVERIRDQYIMGEKSTAIASRFRITRDYAKLVATRRSRCLDAA